MKHQFRLLLFTFLIAAQSGFAQDKHFSQFFANPLTLNPALSGAFDGRLRLTGIYRDQWRDQLSEPFVTFAGSLDLRVPVGKKGSNYKDALGVGILFFSDNVSPLEFSTNKIAVATAYHKSLNPKNTQYLSLGIQGGIEQRNINFGNINFSDQFDGTNGYSDPSAEDLPQNNFAYADFAVGLNYTIAPKGKTALFVGGAIHHFLTPSLSFYNIDAEETQNFFPESELFIKYSAHLALQIPIADRIQLLPRTNFQLQGPHLAANAGTNLRFLVGQYSGTALHIGAWMRGVAGITDPFAPDALVGLFGIEYQNVLFGFSYDMNLKTLNGTNTGQGAFEVSIAYLGNYENETVLCPKF